MERKLTRGDGNRQARIRRMYRWLLSHPHSTMAQLEDGLGCSTVDAYNDLQGLLGVGMAQVSFAKTRRELGIPGKGPPVKFYHASCPFDLSLKE